MIISPAAEIDTVRLLDRACSALLGVALGDALGMPSQGLSRAQIRTHYRYIDDFLAPFDDHPWSHGLQAGQVTDDTEQTLLLGRHLCDGEADRFDEIGWAQALLAWEQGVRQRGLRDLLGPSTKRALQALLAGTPAAQAGRHGTTNGAAMRITPIGIAISATPLSSLVDQVERVCRVTHNTGEAIAGAAAVAAVISQGLDGAGFEDSLSIALQAATLANRRGYATGETHLAERIERALALAASAPDPDLFALTVGTSVATHESVPAAFGVVRLARGDPWRAAVLAANLGDDTDTIGAIATAMAAACAGIASLPDAKLRPLCKVNELSDLQTLAHALVNRRLDAARQA